MTNVKGRIFRVTQKSTLVVSSLKISNNSCSISGLFQSGCVFYLDSLSSLKISEANIINVTNIDSPAAFYVENSNLTLVNTTITNIESFVGFGCLYSFNSFTYVINSSFIYFKNGCFQIEKSSFVIMGSRFVNTNVSNVDNVYGAVIECTLCVYILIDSSLFQGNKNNAMDGSVNF